MQTIYQDEDERSSSRKVNSVGPLIYIGGSADIWKENTLEDLEGRLLEYKIVE